MTDLKPKEQEPTRPGQSWRFWEVLQASLLAPVSDNVSLGDVMDDVTPRWIGNCCQGSNAFVFVVTLAALNVSNGD